MSQQNKKKRFAPKLQIKNGDTVVVIAGSSKGKRGVIKAVFPDKYRAIVEGANMVTKHQKPTSQNTAGGRIEMEAPIHISNLMLVDPKTGEPTRIGRRLEDGKSVRYSKKSGETIK